MLVGLALLGCDAPGNNHKESLRRLVVALVFVVFVFLFLGYRSGSGLITINVSRQPVCQASRHLGKPQDKCTDTFCIFHSVTCECDRHSMGTHPLRSLSSNPK